MSVSARRRKTTWSYHQPDSTIALAQRLADELARRWMEGERPATEEYLTRYPHVAARAEAALELIYEEMCQQRYAEEQPRPSVWLRRFPQWRPQIEMLLACHDLLENTSGERSFPDPGETFGEFQLLDQFGHGAHGRVYLARQPSLADRPVVLKLSSLAGQEHLSLARLQHTYIMPLYWAQDDASSGLRALCMPFFGGTSLSELLSRLSDVPPARRTGRDMLAALVAAADGLRLAPPVRGPACRFMEQASYIEVVCTIGACLAEALAYAHERNVVHHDLKPSNVLIAADGQPLLLDFHLAQPALEAGSISVAWLGGTPGYMAPEHEAALEALEARQPIPQAVDGQADIYSLGMLLCEALAGEHPPSGEPPARWLRRRNSQVSAALADLLAKCTARDPSQRYTSGGALAVDLRRHLACQPLKYVANRSLAERWQKWRRRRPYALMATFLSVGVVASCVVLARSARQRWQEAERALDEAELEIEQRNFEWARVATDRGLYLAKDLPWRGALWQDLQTASVLAQKGYLIHRLHLVVEQLRALYADDHFSREQAQYLDSDVRRLWDQRQALVDQVPPHHHWSQDQAKQDLVDLAIFWADLHWRLADEESRQRAAQEGLEVLLDVERLAGARLVLCREQEKLGRFLGLHEFAAKAAQRAAVLTPASAWEQYALGRSAFSAGDIESADAHFSAAIRSKPNELWPTFYHGRAAYELKRYDDALTAFAICVALAPRAGWCYFNRGLANMQLGRTDEARDDFDRALELNPHLAAAALERGMLMYREQLYDDALADLERAAAERADPAAVAYGLALVYAAKGDRASALEQLDALFARQGDHEGGQKLAKSLRSDAE